MKVHIEEYDDFTCCVVLLGLWYICHLHHCVSHYELQPICKNQVNGPDQLEKKNWTENIEVPYSKGLCSIVKQVYMIQIAM